MPTSQTEIINMALTHCGADIALNSEAETENSRLMKARFPSNLDTVLRMHPWNSAMSRAKLPSAGPTPAFGWEYAYELPPEPYCLRVWRINERALYPQGDPYAVEGRTLLTNVAAPVELRYISRPKDLSRLDAALVEVIALRLAWLLAYRISQSRTLKSELRGELDDLLVSSRSIDAQEGTPELPVPSAFLQSRA